MDEALISQDAVLRAALTRRRFLPGSAAGAIGVAAATVAACAPAPPAAWLYQTASPAPKGTALAAGTLLPPPTMNMATPGTPTPSGSPSNDQMDAEMKA